MKLIFSFLLIALISCNEKELLSTPPVQTDDPVIVFFIGMQKYAEFTMDFGDRFQTLKTSDSTYKISLAVMNGSVVHREFNLEFVIKKIEEDIPYFPLKCEFSYNGYDQWNGRDNGYLQITGIDREGYMYGEMQLITDFFNGSTEPRNQKAVNIYFYKIKFR